MSTTQGLINVEEALQLTPTQSADNHKLYGNSGLATLLGMLGLERQFVRAEGSYLWDSEGNRYLDFLAGYGALSLGHNHPRVLHALQKVENFPISCRCPWGQWRGH